MQNARFSSLIPLLWKSPKRWSINV